MSASDALTQEIGEQLLRLSRIMSSITLHFHADVVSLGLVGLDRTVTHVERPSLLQALLAGTNSEPLKRCSRCRAEKPIEEFPCKSSARDGRASHCRVCDRKRLAKWYPRKMRAAARRKRKRRRA